VATSNDREKARLFMSKMKELAESNHLRLDDSTMLKIKELLQYKREVDDKEGYELSLEAI